ncbi:MAG: transporter permease, partial [Actinomycetia bacterium]|nr:transporter permease [Actinomycetes bacterium]
MTSPRETPSENTPEDPKVSTPAADPDHVPAWQAILRGLGPRKVALQIGAPILAVGIALIITMIVLRLTGADPFNAISSMIDYGTTSSSVVAILYRATCFYLSSIEVALGFRMSLFNIGVDGQYRMA